MEPLPCIRWGPSARLTLSVGYSSDDEEEGPDSGSSTLRRWRGREKMTTTLVLALFFKDHATFLDPLEEKFGLARESSFLHTQS